MKFSKTKIQNNISNDLDTLSSAVRYCEWIYSTFEDFLGRRVLEIGAGTGNITQFLMDRELVFATDIDSRFVEVLDKRFGHLDNFNAQALDVTQVASRISLLREYRFDNIILNNVLEHIEDDLAVVQWLLDCLQPSGKLTIVVPAQPFLFNSLDAAYGHYRRYMHDDFERFAEVLGVQIIHSQYFNVLGVLGWFVNGSLLRRTELPSTQAGLFDRMVPTLRRIESFVGLSYGLSISVTMQKIK